jgi:hypothetical protein
VELQMLASVKEREFIESYAPEPHEDEAYAYALKSYRDFQRYGLPREGGTNRQPVAWKIAMDLVFDAIKHGEAEAENYGALANG